MEGEQINSMKVTSTKQENSRSLPKQDCSITKEIFDSAAKFRTKRMLDKALQMRQNRTVNDEENIIDLNDAEDFKEVPKFRRKLRLKTKSSPSLSNVIFNDVIVIDEKNPSQSLAGPYDNKHVLPLGSKNTIMNEGFTHLKEVDAAYSKENTNLVPENGSVNKILLNSSTEQAKKEGNYNFQTCLVCGMDIDMVDYKKHRLNCLRQNFSKPDKAQSIERIEQVKCHLCSKNITYMNSRCRAQHINKCLDKNGAARQDEIFYEQQLSAARTAVLNCPMCGRKFKVQSSRQSHLKRCAVTNKMTVDQVKNLVKQQEEEHQTKLNAGILPEDFMLAKSKPLQRKNSKTSRLKGQLDEDTQLALALSTSLAENQKEDFDSYLGLADRACKEEQVVAGRGHGKSKKGKLAASASLLMTLTREEAMARISDRITRYIFSANQTCSDPATSPFKMENKLKTTASSASLVSSSSPILWTKTSLDMSALRSSQSLMGMTGDLSFYVKELMPPVSVNTVFAGSKLKRVSTIPGRRMSGEIKRHIETETNVNISISSPPSSQTVEILTRLAMESDQDKGEDVGCRLSGVETELKQEATDEDCIQQPSGFCNESPVKIESPPSDIASSYLSLVNCPRFSDLVIMADNQTQIHAHKLILHARCPELLNMSLMKDGSDVIDLTSYGKESILCMLNYVYGGQISLYTSCLADVKQLADRFSLTGLEAAVENLSVDNVTAARSECNNESNTDEGGNMLEEINEKDAFDESDWLDVFHTQRENLKLRTELVDGSDFTSENEEMLELNEGMSGNCYIENETFIENNEVDVKDIYENNDLNKNNVRRLHINETSFKFEHIDQENDMICSKHLKTNNNNNGDLSMRCGNEETFNSTEEQIQTLSLRLTNPQALEYNFRKTFTDIDNNHSTESVPEIIRKGMKRNITTIGADLESVDHSLLTGHSPHADLTGEQVEHSLLTDHSPHADITREQVEQSLLTGHSPLADVTRERVELNITENSLFMDHSPLTGITREPVELNTSENSLLISLADVTKIATSQNNDTTVSSQERKRKRKKVSQKEFKTLVHKALSSLSNTTTDSFQKFQADLTDEDIERIQIKIEQGLQSIDDPNDSVYIPNVLEDTGKDRNEVIITHADIKTPVKKKRKHCKKSNVNVPIKDSLFPEPSANHSLYVSSSLTSLEDMTPHTVSVLTENILQQISLTATVNSNPLTPQKSALMMNSSKTGKTTNISPLISLKPATMNSSKTGKATNISPLISLKPATIHSSPVTPQKSVLVNSSEAGKSENNSPLISLTSTTINSSKTGKTENVSPLISLTSTTINSSPVTSHTFLLQGSSSKLSNSSQIEAVSSPNVKVANSAHKQLSWSPPFHCSGRSSVEKQLRKCLKSFSNSSLDSTSQASQTSVVSVDESLTSEPTFFNSSSKNPAGEKSTLSSPNSSNLNNSISNYLYEDKVKNCQGQGSPFVSRLLHTYPTSLSTESADAAYISGEELFSDEEEESRPSNSEVLPRQWLDLLVDVKESGQSCSRAPPTKFLSPSADNENESRPSNSETKHSKWLSPSDPSWMLATQLMSYSPALKEISKKNVLQEDRSVRRNIFSLDNSGTSSATSILHSPNPSADTFKQTHQGVCMKSHNLAVDSPNHVQTVISFPDTQFSKTKKDSTTKSNLKEKFAGDPSAVTIPQFLDTLATLPTTFIDKKNTHSLTAVSTVNPIDIHVTSVLKSQISSVLKPQVSSVIKSQISSVLKSQISSELKTQISSELKTQMTSELKTQMTALKPQLKIDSSSIKSPNKKMPQSFGHAVYKSYAVKNNNNNIQESLTTPFCNSSDTVVSSVPRTSKNNIPTTQSEKNLICEKLPKDVKLCQNFASFHSRSPNKNGVTSDHMPASEVFNDKLTISSHREVQCAYNPTQFKHEKSSLTREPLHDAKLIDADDLLPLRQRLGLSNPFKTCSGQLAGLRNTTGGVALNSRSGSSSSNRVETIAQSAADNKTLEKQNISILNLNDSVCMEDSEIKNLLEDLPEKTCSMTTPKHQTLRKMKNKKRAWKEPSPFTPMAPYDAMATPELKKAVSKIGVRPIGKKRMIGLLKHVYRETHQYETDSDYDGTPVKHKRDNSQSSQLSTRAMLSHLPITTSGVDLVNNKLKPSTKKIDSKKLKPAAKKADSKKLSHAEMKNTNLIPSGYKLPDSQHKRESQSQALESHNKRFQESSSECASVSEDIGDSHEEISGSQDSSYSDGADLPEESILQGWPEDDIAPSQLMQTNSQAVRDKLVQFVNQNKDVYESILMYKPLELDVLKKRLSDAAIKVNLSQVMDFLDERCITFTMKNMSSRNNNRQRKVRPKHSGKSPSKSKTLSQKTAIGSQQKNHK